MKKLNTKRCFILLVLLIITLVVYNYIYKSHRNIETETPSFVISTSNLINEFTLDNKNSSKKYIDKTIQISGIVTSIDVSNLEIDTVISCYFNETIVGENLLNTKIIVKGRCIGFDELLEEIKMDQCIIITN